MKVIIRENTWLLNIFVNGEIAMMELQDVIPFDKFPTRGIMDYGWGNGYVLIPKNHHLHGKPYDKIKVKVHGGLTFGELLTPFLIERFGWDMEDEGKWCVGFDTMHYDDTLINWPKERVQLEAERLKEQLMALK